MSTPPSSPSCLLSRGSDLTSVRSRLPHLNEIGRHLPCRARRIKRNAPPETWVQRPACHVFRALSSCRPLPTATHQGGPRPCGPGSWLCVRQELGFLKSSKRSVVTTFTSLNPVSSHPSGSLSRNAGTRGDLQITSLALCHFTKRDDSPGRANSL